MLKLSIWELIFRTIPEGFVFIFASYAIAGKDIEKGRYILSSILLGVIGYLIRMLPIHFGVHTILLIMVHILMTSTINKIEVKRAVSAALISVIIMFLSEGLNVVMLDKVFKVEFQDVMSNVYTKLVYGIPSFVLFAIIILVIHFVLRKIKRG